MRLPRFRLTIGGLLILVPLAGLATWMWVIPYVDTPGLAERRALSAYNQAALAREVAEYALVEYREGVFSRDQEAIRDDVALAAADLARLADRARREESPRPGAPPRPWAEVEAEVRRRHRDDRQVAAIQGEIAKARAAEAAARAAYEAERARRWQVLGL